MKTYELIRTAANIETYDFLYESKRLGSVKCVGHNLVAHFPCNGPLVYRHTIKGWNALANDERETQLDLVTRELIKCVHNALPKKTFTVIYRGYEFGFYANNPTEAICQFNALLNEQKPIKYTSVSARVVMAQDK